MWGDSANRFDDYRKLLFEINPCTPDPAKSIVCNANPQVELAKMQLVIYYNTERFDKHDPSSDPIIREGIARTFDFNPAKRYELKTQVVRGYIEENRGLYENSEADFYELHVDEFGESPREGQTAYVSGVIGLSRDQIHI